MDDPNEINIPLRLTHRHPPFGVDKVFVSGRLAGPRLSIGDGNHYAALGDDVVRSEDVPGLRLAHFAERSPHQLAAKWIRGWSKVLAAGPSIVAKGVSVHYRGQFETFRDNPTLLLRDHDFMHLRDARPMTNDPMTYLGGPLVFTCPLDHTMRSVSVIVGHLEELASRYGRLLESSPEAAAMIKAWDEDLKILLGEQFTPFASVAAPNQTSTTMPPPAPPAARPRWAFPRLSRKSRRET